jgi:hypothetical protein
VELIPFDTATELAKLDAELPAITPRSTRKSPERRAAHKARMEGKVYNREHLPRERSEITTKAQFRRLIGNTSIAQFNRHTRRPHENAREIMRRTMSVAERRAFTAQVGGQLGLAA